MPYLKQGLAHLVDYSMALDYRQHSVPEVVQVMEHLAVGQAAGSALPSEVPWGCCP